MTPELSCLPSQRRQLALRLSAAFFIIVFSALVEAKTPIKALYVPLADHYAGIVAYERYAGKMQHADFQIEQSSNWDLLRTLFQEKQADIAFVMAPLALDMYLENPDFKWIGLMHRDGNALAINHKMATRIALPALREHRKPDASVAYLVAEVYEKGKMQTSIALPHLLSTHTVVLYAYLQQYGVQLALSPNRPGAALAVTVPPPLAPAFLRRKNNISSYAAFEQSLPWADVVETESFGKVAWYSKDVLQWPKGHVECIAIASKDALAHKREALREVMEAIHQAGADIEAARIHGGSAMQEIVELVRKHMPAHTAAAIRASLDPNLRVINYEELNVDIEGLRLIMDIAVRGKILKQQVVLEDFAETDLTITPTTNRFAKR